MFFFGRQSDPNRVFPECFVCIDFLVPQETAADTPAFSPHFPKKSGSREEASVILVYDYDPK